jgi:hypothetical protein
MTGFGGFQPTFPSLPVIYLEKNVDKYGVIEGKYINDDIFPHRTGKVTSVDVANPNVIIDSTLFNINDYLQPGLAAKIVFTSGQLAGYTFDISSYNDGTKTITFLKNKNDVNIEVPSSLIKPAIGDEYVLIDITMPDEYVEAAEEELLNKATEILNTYSQPQYTIQAETDTKYMKMYNRELFVGNTIWIKDVQFEIDRKIRITQVIRNLVEPFQFQITLSDVLAAGKLDTLVQNVSGAQRSVSDLGNTVVSRDVFNGQMVLPPSSTASGAVFENVLVDKNTNKLYRQE